jgi:hypothetical protein
VLVGEPDQAAELQMPLDIAEHARIVRPAQSASTCVDHSSAHSADMPIAAKSGGREADVGADDGIGAAGDAALRPAIVAVEVAGAGDDLVARRQHLGVRRAQATDASRQAPASRSSRHDRR